MTNFVSIYTQPQRAESWIQHTRHQLPVFLCVLGFTETGLLPGISAAGATPADREFTAIADAEFLVNGVQPNPHFPLPPLTAGASPVWISRAVIERLALPVHVLDAGLPRPTTVPSIALGGVSARCLSSGKAIDRSVVEHLFHQGLEWGETFAEQYDDDRYFVIGECVVGGTTTALSILLGLKIAAAGKVNSSHPVCNHAQKLELVQAGLSAAQDSIEQHPFAVLAAVGDPMQCVVAGLTIALSRTRKVLLAGGTQMLAVYAMTRAIATSENLDWNPEQVVVGTTRWVAEDSTGDTVGLATAIGDVPLLATPLSFARSRYPQLQIYEEGFVKEGVGAGGLAIAASLCAGWSQPELLSAIEQLMQRRESPPKFPINGEF